MPTPYRDMTDAQKEKHRNRVRKWQAQHPDKVKTYRKLARQKATWRYDPLATQILSRQQFAYEVTEQNGECLICHKVPKRLYVSVDPRTQEYRGLICIQCLRGLEKFDDSSLILHAAANFVRKQHHHPINDRLLNKNAEP